MVTIVFYNNTAGTNVLDKTSYLNELNTVNGLMYDTFNLINTTLLIRYFNNNSNYCYIRELNKYFFIENVEIVDNTKVKLTLKLDVLQTFKEEIKELYVTISEREKSNGYINNRSVIYDIRPNFDKIGFPNQIFDETGQIMMITIKGDK